MTELHPLPRKFSLMRLSSFVAIIAAVAACAYWYGISSVNPPSEQESLSIYRLDQPAQNRLDPKYLDRNGDLVADPPDTPDQFLEPEVLTFGYITSDQDRYKEVWTDFLEYLHQQTGIPSEYVVMDSADAQLRALQSGKLHIAGVNTGSVPFAVNACGFVPICGFGMDDSPMTYTMRLITTKKSPIDSPAAIAGRTLTLTNPASNSGWKAPLTLMKEQFHLLPMLNFDVIYSNSHAASLAGIASGLYEVAAVASGEMDLAIERGIIAENQIRVIYESQPYPNNVFGHVHNLNVDLADSIQKAFLEFPWEDSELRKEFIAMGADSFVRISYKDDLNLIRMIDDAMGRRHVIGPDVEEDSESPENTTTR